MPVLFNSQAFSQSRWGREKLGVESRGEDKDEGEKIAVILKMKHISR